VVESNYKEEKKERGKKNKREVEEEEGDERKGEEGKKIRQSLFQRHIAGGSATT
jgi:hypothetical protein